MEEDVGVKVTVTRLRRRLSVEQPEDGSSPGPATPTKKRGGRLAAKPQLELIEENTPVSSPRKTRRKSLATEGEERPITPSRRSARIKSNSSIVSETLTVQATDSPRAKRAARRKSQAGSDNEGPTTPARQGRRTRKDSASSVENQESGTLNKPLPVAEMVIEEEPENEVQKTTHNSKSSPTATGEEWSPNSASESKSMLEKRNRMSGSHKTDQVCSSHSIKNKSLNISTENEKTQSETHIDLHNSSNRSVEAKKSDYSLSESNMSLLNKLEDTETNRFDSNKSASALDITGNFKTKRNRTESWQEVVASVTIDSITFSDTELFKKGKDKSKKLSFSLTDDSTKINKPITSLNEENTSLSFLDTSSKRKKRKSETNTEDAAKPCEDIQTEVLTPKEIISNKVTARDNSDNTDVTRDMAKLFENLPSNVQATVYFEDSDSNSVNTGTVNKSDKLESEDQCVPEVNVISRPEKNLLPNQIKDSDKASSNVISISNVVSADVNDSCEPMDIDETMHDEILQKSLDTLQQSNTERKSPLSPRSIIEDTDNSQTKITISGSDTPDRSKNEKRKLSLSNTAVDTTDSSKDNKRKSSISNTTLDTAHRSKDDKRKSLNTTVDIQETSKKDKRKSSISKTPVDSPNRSENNKRTSSISNSTADTPDLFKNDSNKSTLILSQLKDVSTTSEDHKTPKPALINEVMSKSDINEYDNKIKKIPKGNLSLNDVKRTPKQNSIQKLSMQTSTPINTQQLGIKTKIEDEKQESVKKINDAYSSEEGSDDDDHSVEKSKLLADEADEASSDYESGDSQSEEEKRYEAENEIVERGETLTSDDDVSNDTDYEKDSFVVSSDADDKELLSGSGDDLSMSDKELSMSKKSKNKFNKRKLKEQKYASREMFESRHTINASDKNSPTSKTKRSRMRIDSSLLASDEEVVAKPKKNNRMRLNSTLDTSANREETNLSLNKSIKNKFTEDHLYTEEKKNNNKFVQNSIYNESAIDEKEITVCNESSIGNTDPLQIQLKQEPKTPQKDLNMSLVQVQQDIENIQITETASILEQTGTDPLQATMAGDDTSDSSGNEEILQNYDSVLNELNKDTQTILDNKNISLDMGNKTKKNPVEPVIDQLNLTHTKKKKNEDQSQYPITIKLSELKQNSDTEDSSSSIDLQLLFSEDNCGSDEDQMVQKNIDNENMFIPLKKYLAKTNLRKSIETNKTQHDTTLNNSTKKKNKLKSSLGPAESDDELEMNTTQHDTINNSMKKKNKRKSSLGPANSVDDQGMDPTQHDTTLNNSTKKKNKRKASLGPAESVDEQAMITTQHDTTMNNSTNEKNKRKSSLGPVNSVDGQELNTSQQDTTLNNSSSSKKKNKRKSSIGSAESVDDQEINTSQQDTTLNNSSKKKNKRKSSLGPAESVEVQEINTSQYDTTLNNSNKKKNNRKYSLEPEESVDEQEIKTSQQNTPLNNSNKTKKKLKSSLGTAESVHEPVHGDDSDGAPEETPYLSQKASEMDLKSLEHVSELAEESSAKKKQKKKKKKKPASSNQSGESIDTETNISSNSKKRKRRSSNAEGAQDSSQGQLDVHNVLEMGSHNELISSNKKRKIAQKEDIEGFSETKQSKKNKKINQDVHFQDSTSAFENTETQVKKNKKRKHRDEDGDNKKTKIAKDSSFQEVHVPRLPDSILRQLDDKPRKVEEAKVISTSNFIVENARQKRVKPSNYLEESIYLDDKSPLAKKEKPRIKKPKVLPFIPTASISDSGFTTNFKINKLAQFTAFEAEPVTFSKESYLQKKKIKRLGTYDRYKKQMHHKMSKF